MFRCEKGEYGYLGKRKLQQLFLTILMGLIGLLIYGIGYISNGYHQNDFCLILGILMVLPGAKFLTTFILLAPYHNPDKLLFKEVSALVKKEETLCSGLVITSTKRAMNLDFLYIGNGCVYGLLGKKKEEGREVEEYLTNGIRNWGTGYTVKMFDTSEQFKKALQLRKEKEVSLEEEERVLAYLYSLMV